MNLKYLPARISIENLVSELGMDQMPFMQALKTILVYAKYHGLPIWFDEDVESVLDADEETGPWFDENNNRLDFQESGYWTPMLDGPKCINDARPYQTENDGEYRLLVSCIYQNNKCYYMPHESGVYLTELDLGLDLFYCERDALEAFISRMETGNKPDTATIIQPTSSRSGVRKALALLARDAAEQNASFGISGKVNASAYKDYILTLAERYSVTDSGLNSLDDKISRSLKDLDIKELTKK